MKPTIHQRVKQIEDVFGIDFRNQPTRNEYRIRIAIASEYPEVSNEEMGKSFKKSRLAICCLRESIASRSKCDKFKQVLVAIEKLDPNLLPVKVTYNNRKLLVKETKPTTVAEKFDRQIVMEVLRKDRKHPLWLKTISAWDNRDWHSFNSLKSTVNGNA